jgi:uncharacterized protein YjiS (DUF1127 family)
MTASTHTHINHFSVPIMNRLAQAYAGFTARRAQRAERARIIRELESYADHELFDLGISRGDIEAVADGRFRRVR